jgi:hypothetical protein
LSEHPRITWDIVRVNRDKPWDHKWLSYNPNITLDIVRDNPDIKWDFHALSRNPNITWDIVRDNPDIKWDFHALSRNPNITWDIVRDNPDKKWHFEHLSANPMPLQKKIFEEKMSRAVKIVEDRWIDRMYEPGSKYVVNVIHRRFDTMKCGSSKLQKNELDCWS